MTPHYDYVSGACLMLSSSYSSACKIIAVRDISSFIAHNNVVMYVVSWSFHYVILCNLSSYLTHEKIIAIYH